jgi:hypothetical protein
VKWVTENIELYEYTMRAHKSEDQSILEMLIEGLTGPERKNLNYVQLFTLARSFGIRMALLFKDLTLFTYAFDRDIYEQQCAFLVVDNTTFIPLEMESDRENPEFLLHWYSAQHWKFAGRSVKIEKQEPMVDAPSATSTPRAKSSSTVETITIDSDEEEGESTRRDSDTAVVMVEEELADTTLSERNIKKLQVESLLAELQIIKAQARKEVADFKAKSAIEVEKLKVENRELKRVAREYQSENERLRQGMRNVQAVVDRALDETGQVAATITLTVQPATSAPVQKKRKKGGTHVCLYCPEEFEDLAERSEHIHNDHGEEKFYECDVDGCSAIYKYETSLDRHRANIHTAGGIKCDEQGCGRTFRTRQGLRDHVGVHTLKYICPYCDVDKSFANSRTLRRHAIDSHKLQYNAQTFEHDVQERRTEAEGRVQQAEADTSHEEIPQPEED